MRIPRWQKRCWMHPIACTEWRSTRELNLISIVQLGTVGYAEGLRLQQQLVDLRKAEKIGDVLLLLEHSPSSRWDATRELLTSSLRRNSLRNVGSSCSNATAAATSL